MVDILHRVGVETPTPEQVYEALTTVEGLAGWWTDETTGSAEVGTLFFARQASAGVVSALQDALLADIGLVAFAFAMTVLLARNSVAPKVEAAASGHEAHPGQHELAAELVS